MKNEHKAVSRRHFSRAAAIAFTGAGLLAAARPAFGQEKSRGILPLTLRSGGLDPSSVAVVAGMYAITIFNHSGLQDALTVELNQIRNGAPETVLSRKIERGATQWFRSVTLAAGSYQLKLSGYTYTGWPSAGLICTITVS